MDFPWKYVLDITHKFGWGNSKSTRAKFHNNYIPVFSSVTVFLATSQFLYSLMAKCLMPFMPLDKSVSFDHLVVFIKFFIATLHVFLITCLN